jgi:hypothetical protein
MAIATIAAGFATSLPAISAPATPNFPQDNMLFLLR